MGLPPDYSPSCPLRHVSCQSQPGQPLWPHSGIGNMLSFLQEPDCFFQLSPVQWFTDSQGQEQ